MARRLTSGTLDLGDLEVCHSQEDQEVRRGLGAAEGPVEGRAASRPRAAPPSTATTAAKQAKLLYSFDASTTRSPPRALPPAARAPVAVPRNTPDCN